MTRRDVTVALYRLAGSPKVELPAFSPYADVATSDPDYAAFIWARQKGITFGWADGKFHPDAPLSTPSTVAFLYRYQKATGNQDAPQSSGGWQHKVRQGSAFWRESRWAVQQRIWGYAKDGRHEYFTWEQTPTDDLALMLYRMEHGGSRLT